MIYDLFNDGSGEVLSGIIWGSFSSSNFLCIVTDSIYLNLLISWLIEDDLDDSKADYDDSLSVLSFSSFSSFSSNSYNSLMTFWISTFSAKSYFNLAKMGLKSIFSELAYLLSLKLSDFSLLSESSPVTYLSLLGWDFYVLLFNE